MLWNPFIEVFSVSSIKYEERTKDNRMTMMCKSSSSLSLGIALYCAFQNFGFNLHK